MASNPQTFTERREYQGWAISFDYPPIPFRGYDYSATHPDYDPSPVYSDDGPSDNRVVYGASIAEVRAEIDEWIAENEADMADLDLRDASTAERLRWCAERFGGDQ